MKNLPSIAPCFEGPAWSDIQGQWRPIYGSFPQMGVSIEWHDFSTEQDLDWGVSFHEESLEICLNFFGDGSWVSQQRRGAVAPKEIALYSGQQSPWQAVRQAGTSHRFITIELSAEFLRNSLRSVMDGVKEEIQRFMEFPDRSDSILQIQPMGGSFLALRSSLLEPSVNKSAYPLWYSSKVMEILSQMFFKNDQPKERFCDRTKRLNKERVEQATYLLRRDLVNPPSLELLAKEVDSSSFHLSRIFAQETGLTIPRYIRMLRIEKARDLLRQGQGNVTEVAFAVGYSSLSAFYQAFVEITGCCPGLYPAKHRVRL